jgi:hypothetical protein
VLQFWLGFVQPVRLQRHSLHGGRLANTTILAVLGMSQATEEQDNADRRRIPDTRT